MINKFKKKVYLTEEEIRKYQKELQYYLNAEERQEDELNSMKNAHKGMVKTKEAEIDASKAERKMYNQKLSQGFDMIEVESVTFEDFEILQQFIVEIKTQELLEVRALSKYAEQTLELDKFRIVAVDGEKIFELLDYETDIYSRGPIVLDEFNWDGKTITICLFADKDQMRCVKLVEGYTFDKLLFDIANYMLSHEVLNDENPETDQEKQSA